ncbi:MAG: hypothetical protein J0I12_31825 [Candidatus Eremiobacteraeota bacterium]|mgnify:CR=1 FL=1|nr:hypothetical protein [Candidatus Eremiobacteraeota bacterium]
MISTCIAALAQAAVREKDRFRPGDYARCAMRYLDVSKNPEKDLTSAWPLLTHSSSDVVQYTWAGISPWGERPLKKATVDRIVGLLENPREQVKINALMWLAGYARSHPEMRPTAWQRVVEVCQSGQPRLRTAGIRLLLESSDTDEARTLSLLAAYLVQPKIDEEDYGTYVKLDRWLDARALEAAPLGPTLAQASGLFEERKLSHLNLRWRALVGPWSAAERELAGRLVQETSLNDVDLNFVPNMVYGLADHGPDGRSGLLVLAGRLARDPGFEDDALVCSALARTGVESAVVGDCLKRFAGKADADHSGLLAAVGASGSKDPLVLKELAGYLNHDSPVVQRAAAYALACLGDTSAGLVQWAGRQDLKNCDGLTIGVLRRLKLKPTLPSEMVDSGESAILRRMAGQADPVWDELLGDLKVGHYPWRCWRCRSLAQKEATLACLELIQAGTVAEEPLAVKMLMGSADPEVARAAGVCYRAVWKP